MTSSTLVTDYLGRGTHAGRPAAPGIPAGGSAVYYETDTTEVFFWDGSAWQRIPPATASLFGLVKVDNTTITAAAGVISAAAGMNQLTGDVTAGPGTGSQAAAIAGHAVTNAKLAQMAAHTHKGNNTAGTADAIDLSVTQLTAELNAVVGDSGAGGTKGLVPAPGAGDTAAGKFLKADGTFAVPPGTGSGLNQLTGDVTAGPGTGSQVATLANTAVAAGSYTSTNLTVDAKGRITAASSGGGGSTGLYAAVMSAVPTAASTGLSTWLNQGGASVADNSTGFTIIAPTAASNLRCRTKTTPVGAFTITVLMAHTSLGQNNTISGIGWYDGSAKLHIIDFVYNAGWQLEVTKWTNVTTFSANDLAVTPLGEPIMWLQLVDDGAGNVSFKFSRDGSSFLTGFTTTKTAGWLGATGYTNIVFTAGAFNTPTDATLMSWTQV